jgi:hypothetical protein
VAASSQAARESRGRTVTAPEVTLFGLNTVGRPLFASNDIESVVLRPASRVRDAPSFDQRRTRAMRRFRRASADSARRPLSAAVIVPSQSLCPVAAVSISPRRRTATAISDENADAAVAPPGQSDGYEHGRARAGLSTRTQRPDTSRLRGVSPKLEPMARTSPSPVQGPSAAPRRQARIHRNPRIRGEIARDRCRWPR